MCGSVGRRHESDSTNNGVALVRLVSYFSYFLLARQGRPCYGCGQAQLHFPENRLSEGPKSLESRMRPIISQFQTICLLIVLLNSIPRRFAVFLECDKSIHRQKHLESNGVEWITFCVTCHVCVLHRELGAFVFGFAGEGMHLVTTPSTKGHEEVSKGGRRTRVGRAAKLHGSTAHDL